MVISRRSLLSAGAAFPASAYGQCVTDRFTVDACMGGVHGSSGPPGMTLDLNFMFPGSLDPRITFTRASTATYTDASGTIQTAATNAPRWDYAGGSLRGLLIEEARTNLLLNSATLGTQSVTVTAQAYTLSFYGTGTITKSGAATGALVGTGAGQRVSQTFTPTAGSLTLTVTGSVLNAQIEAGSFVTSWIPTTSVAVTRAQDSCTISAANMTPWFAPPGGSWFAEFIDFNPTSALTPRVIAYPLAGNIYTLAAGTGLNAYEYDGAGAVSTSNSFSPNTVVKAVSTWAAGAAKICLNAGVVTLSVTLSGGFAGFASAGVQFMANATAGDGMSGYIRRVQYWPRVLSDAEMQQVTT